LSFCGSELLQQKGIRQRKEKRQKKFSFPDLKTFVVVNKILFVGKCQKRIFCCRLVAVSNLSSTYVGILRKNEAELSIHT
jgi:hypothetical protein